MTTPQEFEYIRRAMAALEQEQTAMTQHKILRTISQITGRAADRIEDQLCDSVDAKLARNYQDIQNNKLVDLLAQ
jgi:hypothetical protein